MRFRARMSASAIGIVAAVGFVIASAAPAAAVDITDPSLTLVFVLGPPSQATFTTEDDESGIVEILVTRSENADTIVPPFIPGTNDPIFITSTRIDQSQPFVVEFRVTDFEGNITLADYTLPPSVPEPATLILVAAALAGVGASAVRRRRGN